MSQQTPEELRNSSAAGIGMVGRNVIKTMDGRKTQTRRIESCLRSMSDLINGCDREQSDDGSTFFRLSAPGLVEYVTPRYQPGNIYYVKEALYKTNKPGGSFAAYQADSSMVIPHRAWQRDTGEPWKNQVIPARYMPKSVARTFIRLISIRCEPLHSISLEDIQSEGCSFCETDEGEDFRNQTHKHDFHRVKFQQLWEQSNGKGSWAENPWVFAYEFKRLEVSK